jgi:hypothetical protein
MSKDRCEAKAAAAACESKFGRKKEPDSEARDDDWRPGAVVALGDSPLGSIDAAAVVAPFVGGGTGETLAARRDGGTCECEANAKALGDSFAPNAARPCDAANDAADKSCCWLARA